LGLVAGGLVLRLENGKKPASRRKKKTTMENKIQNRFWRGLIFRGGCEFALAKPRPGGVCICLLSTTTNIEPTSPFPAQVVRARGTAHQVLNGVNKTTTMYMGMTAFGLGRECER
jgi:hypothetical protein